MKLRVFRNESRDDYLEAILRITQEKGFCRSIDIAEGLEVSKPSVSAMVGKLAEEGLISLDEDKLLRLTETGAALAADTYEKHRYFLALLLSSGVDPEIADREACALEHAVSRETFMRIRRRYPMEEDPEA